jgi:carbon-monoxide dehydrogenase medium subunit
VRERLPILVEATAEVGYVGIRNRGTVGGAIAHADPVAEWPCLALALDAQVVLAGPQARRTLTVDDFFLGMFETAIAPGEMLVEVRFPARAARSGWGFREFSRKTGDYAVVAVAVDIGATGGTIDHVRVAISNLADRPVRSARVEQLLTGRDAGAGADDAVLAAVPGAVAAEHPAGPEPALRHEIAGTLVARAIADALARLQGGADE